jgi:hypothetical protein
VCLLCTLLLLSMCAAPNLLHYKLLQKAKNESKLLHDLKVCISNLTPSGFLPEFQSTALNQPGQELTGEKKAFREFWRIRRFIRDKKGMPVDEKETQRTQSPPAKRQRTPQLEETRRSPSLTRKEYDPERTVSLSGRYSPTQGHHDEEEEYEEYEEMEEENA